MAAAASALLLRGLRLPSLRARVPATALSRRLAAEFSTLDTFQPLDAGSPAALAGAKGPLHQPPPPPPPPPSTSWMDQPEFRRWKDKEAEILKDIEPITFLTKDILHSDRYVDGERLNDEDEKAVIEKLLAYHPHSVDKIGSGLDSIMVDRHPQYRNSRCLFVVRTDGGWIDFSYQKCLRAYIQDKYPSYAERFIREHYKR